MIIPRFTALTWSSIPPHFLYALSIDIFHTHSKAEVQNPAHHWSVNKKTVQNASEFLPR